MEDRRFDVLARTVASSGTRRGFLGALVAGLVALGRTAPAAAAPGGYLGPGASCDDSSQCGDSRYNTMVCDDNGIDDDGPLNCCAYEYGYCYGDDGCCGGLVCVDGSCSLADMGGLPLGEQCFGYTQCFDGGNGVECADNGGFVPACCLIGGQFCSQDLDCCMPNSCVGGICQ